MDVPLIAPYERLAASRAEMAEAEGISVRTLQRRLNEQREEASTRPLPVVPLTYGRTDVGGDHYNFRSDAESVLPSGLFRIGTARGRRLQVGHAGDGKPVEQAQESKHKFKPKTARKKQRTG